MDKKFKQGLVPAGHYTAAQMLSVMHGSYRQLDYWCRTGLAGTYREEGLGSGYWRYFSRAEALQLLRVDALSKIGLTLTSIRAFSRDQVLESDAVRITVDTSKLEQVLDTLTTT